MVLNHGQQNPSEAYANVLQGRVLSNESPLPDVVWNQIKVLVLSNQNGKSTMLRTRPSSTTFIA